MIDKNRLDGIFDIIEEYIIERHVHNYLKLQLSV